MIRTILKVILASPFIAVIVIIVVVNAGLLIGPSTTPSNIRLLKELRSLKSDLANGADVRMQQLYPEGYVFLNALYGLAWCNFVELSGEGTTYYEEAHTEIQAAWERINSPVGRSGFTEELAPEFGSFYRGWNNYLLGKKLILEPTANRLPAEVAAFQSSCEEIANALKSYTYPVSYYEAAWPADVVVCIASLSLFRDMQDNRYDSLIQRWMVEAKERYDDHGLIPHHVVAGSGKAIGSARGSSQSLMLILLKEIDSEFANSQFTLYKTNFLDTRLGLTGVREFSKEEFGMGDVDSGPVVLGFGAASSIVGATTMSLFGEHESASRLSALIEAVGVPLEDNDRRYYLMGALPIADAFITWGHSLTLEAEPVSVSFTTFHLYSMLALLVLLMIVFILVKPAKPDSAKALVVEW